jgi:hypothetical protein
MNKIKILILSLVYPLLLATQFAPVQAYNIFGDACSGSAANSPTCQQARAKGSEGTNSITGSNNIINTAANIIALITGIAAVIMIIISGFTMITSGGNAESFKTARQRLLAAIIGLVIVALAWLIIRFVTDKVIQ